MSDAMVMIVKWGCIASLLLASAGMGAAHAQDARVAMRVRIALQERDLPAREIERRMLAQHRGQQYLGFEYDPDTKVYTFKFVRNGCVIKVYVNSRGQRVGGESC